LELNPRNADAYAGRGDVRAVLGDYTNAVANYDKVLALRPANSEWDSLYRQALLWRLGRPPPAEAKPAAGGQKAAESAMALEPVVVYGAGPHRKERWAKSIALFQHGSLDEKELLAAARKSDGTS